MDRTSGRLIASWAGVGLWVLSSDNHNQRVHSGMARSLSGTEKHFPTPKIEPWELGSGESCLVRQWIRPHLELHELARGPFATFHMKWCSRRDGRIEAL